MGTSPRGRRRLRQSEHLENEVLLVVESEGLVRPEEATQLERVRQLRHVLEELHLRSEDSVSTISIDLDKC